MAEIIIMIDLIHGIVGGWQKLDSTKDSESKNVRPLYRPSNALPYNDKFPIEIPSEQIKTIEIPINYRGQYSTMKFIIPSRDMKDVDYEKTVYFQIFKDTNSRVEDLTKKNRDLAIKLDAAEIELKKLRARSEDNKPRIPQQKTTPCPKCKTEYTDLELYDSGGFCKNGGCGERVKIMPPKKTT